MTSKKSKEKKTTKTPNTFYPDDPLLPSGEPEVGLGADGKFTDGDPSIGQLPSRLPSSHLNLLTDNIAEVILDYLGKIDNVDITQLKRAIEQRVYPLDQNITIDTNQDTGDGTFNILEFFKTKMNEKAETFQFSSSLMPVSQFPPNSNWKNELTDPEFEGNTVLNAMSYLIVAKRRMADGSYLLEWTETLFGHDGNRFITTFRPTSTSLSWRSMTGVQKAFTPTNNQDTATMNMIAEYYGDAWGILKNTTLVLKRGNITIDAAARKFTIAVAGLYEIEFYAKQNAGNQSGGPSQTNIKVNGTIVEDGDFGAWSEVDINVESKVFIKTYQNLAVGQEVSFTADLEYLMMSCKQIS